MKSIELPKVTSKAHPGHEELEYSHPAFGTVVVTHPRGGNDRMFGSDTFHNTRVTLTVHEATLHRNLSNDWIYPSKVLGQFSFTEAQWAQFVASAGKGEGTPCTLEYVSQGPLTDIPRIGGEPEKLEQFASEMRSKFLQRMASVDLKIAEVEKMLTKGSANKSELKAILSVLSNVKDGLANSIEFVGDQFVEHMEKEQVKAKIEIEGFVSRYAKELGFQMIAEGHRLKTPEPETHTVTEK